MARHGLTLFFVLVLLTLSAATVTASLDRDVFSAAAALWPDPWFRATLVDAYFAFLTIYLWVAYKETTWLARLVWLLLFVTLGNFAIAGYGLRQIFLFRGRPFTIEALLLRQP